MYKLHKFSSNAVLTTAFWIILATVALGGGLYFKNRLLTKLSNPAVINQAANNVAPTISKPETGNKTESEFIWPTTGVMTTKYKDIHPALDIANNTKPDVVASRAGKVLYAGWRGSYGNVVEIDHLDGYVSSYSNMGNIIVHPDDMVIRGQKIGVMGSTGMSTGIHLHFAILKDRKFIDPFSVFQKTNGSPTPIISPVVSNIKLIGIYGIKSYKINGKDISLVGSRGKFNLVFDESSFAITSCNRPTTKYVIEGNFLKLDTSYFRSTKMKCDLEFESSIVTGFKKGLFIESLSPTSFKLTSYDGTQEIIISKYLED